MASEDKDWLFRTLARAFWLRATVAIVLHVTGFSGRLAPDESTYAGAGQVIAAYWSGDLLAPPWRLSSTEPLAYFYMNGISFLLFGSSLPLKIANCMAGALTCLFAYRLAGMLYGSDVARRTASLVAYFPSLVLWSCLNIRDVWVLLLLVYASWKSLQLVAGFSIGSLIPVLAVTFAVNWFRPYLYFVVALPPIAALLLGRKKTGRNAVLALVAGLIIVFLDTQGVGKRAFDLMDLEALSAARRNLAYGAASSFEENTDISTPGKAAAFLPKALLYFWFSPFPWQITSVLKLLSMPEVLLVYFLTPRIVRGIGFTIRHRLREGFQVMLLTSLLTVSYALGSGNVGTLFRHRAQAMVFYLAFAAAGTRKVAAGGVVAPGRAVVGAA